MYYFAYGSNMHWPQMQRRCASSQFVCVARLPDYQIAIARHSQLRRCGTANIFPDRQSVVWGIVYQISDRDLVVLDSFEDGYRREIVAVYANQNGHQAIESIVYIAPKEKPPPPNPEYKRLIVEGARYWRLPNSYIAMLEEIQVAE